jgi:hypothetical protein
MRRIMFATATVLALTSGAAFASDELCDVPQDLWRPMAELKTELEGQGWNIRTMKTDNGCYEAYAIDGEGKKVEAYFDPKTFEVVKTKVEG